MTHDAYVHYLKDESFKYVFPSEKIASSTVDDGNFLHNLHSRSGPWDDGAILAFSGNSSCSSSSLRRGEIDTRLGLVL